MVTTMGGIWLRFVALVLGIRVTSWWRSAAEQAELIKVGGAVNSAHLRGGALDFGIETPDWKRDLVARFSAQNPTDGVHQGTAEHYHYTGGIRGALAVVIVALLVMGRLGFAKN